VSGGQFRNEEEKGTPGEDGVGDEDHRRNNWGKERLKHTNSGPHINKRGRFGNGRRRAQFEEIINRWVIRYILSSSVMRWGADKANLEGGIEGKKIQ